MIIKSMSRKEPSFGQLVAYMSDEKSERAFDLHHNVFTRDPGDIAAAFEENARLLGKRKGGNYLFHEILSIDTRACGQEREVKEKLRLLALEYIEHRCARSMVYGALHRDHEGHLHYHLMISANERGEAKRQRLTPGQFAQVKREMERHVRETYPELKQERIMDVSNEERAERRQLRKSRSEQEMEKRGVKLTKKQQLAQELQGMMAYASSQAEFERMLRENGFEFYERGKHFGVRPLAEAEDGKKPRAHRFSTLGIHDEYEAFLDRVELVIEPDRVEGEKEKEPEQTAPERDGPNSDNDGYVEYDGNTDLNCDPASQQEREPDFDVRKEDMSRDTPAPNTQRHEMIDKGHVEADPNRDGLRDEEWKGQDKFMTKVQQSWRRTMDDFRGRTKDLEGRARGKGDDDEERER